MAEDTAAPKPEGTLSGPLSANAELKPEAKSDVKPRDLGALEKAVNDAAGKVTTTWVGLLSLATYLALATGSVTHEDLLLEDAASIIQGTAGTTIDASVRELRLWT